MVQEIPRCRQRGVKRGTLRVVRSGVDLVKPIGRHVLTLAGDGKVGEKRFEISTLKKLLPIYIIYLIVLAVWPATITAGEWQHNIIYEELVFEERIVFTFRFVEFIAAFTLLGYIIAEMRGRKNEAAEATLGWTFLIAVGSAIFIEVAKNYPSLNNISILSIVIITCASIYGAVIYRLHLSAIKRLTR